MAVRPADHGVVASSGGAVTDFYTLLAETTMANSSTSSVNFYHSSDWDDYDDLLMTIKAQNVNQGPTRDHWLKINNTSQNYAYSVHGNSAWNYRIYQSNQYKGLMRDTSSGTYNTNSWSYGQIRFSRHQNADSDNAKCVMHSRWASRGGDAGGTYCEWIVVAWANMTGGISRIELHSWYDGWGQTTNYRTGSNFALFGLTLQ